MAIVKCCQTSSGVNNLNIAICSQPMKIEYNIQCREIQNSLKVNLPF